MDMKSKHDKICPVCKKHFHVKCSGKKYCSENCKRKAYYKRNKKWVLERSKNRTIGYKEKALKYYNYKCAICCWQITKPTSVSYGCDVHHIIPCCDGGSDDLDNVIVLCPNCHRYAHLLGNKSIDYLRHFIKVKEEIDLKNESLERLRNCTNILEDLFK